MIVTQNEKVTDPGEVAPEKNCYYRAFTWFSSQSR
jgi:hypothetical protein